MIVVDFEAEAIRQRPVYPPKQVGPSNATTQGKTIKTEYLSWGHPTGNNCTEAQARRRLGDLWKGPEPLAFFNAKFDLDVGETHLGLPQVPRAGHHDVMLMGFVEDPNRTYGDFDLWG